MFDDLFTHFGTSQLVTVIIVSVYCDMMYGRIGVIRNYVSPGFTREGATGNIGYWSDGTQTDTVIGHWNTNQPDDQSGRCVKVTNAFDQLYPWSMQWCGERLPFICQRPACLEGRILFGEIKTSFNVIAKLCELLHHCRT